MGRVERFKKEKSLLPCYSPAEEYDYTRIFRLLGRIRPLKNINRTSVTAIKIIGLLDYGHLWTVQSRLFEALHMLVRLTLLERKNPWFSVQDQRLSSQSPLLMRCYDSFKLVRIGKKHVLLLKFRAFTAPPNCAARTQKNIAQLINTGQNADLILCKNVQLR